MSFGKKITALLASLAVVVSSSGCGTGKNTSWSARYNEYESTAGIFIYYEMNAYYEALNKAKELNSELDTTDKNALKATQIDNKDMLKWIQDEATENLRKYLAVQAEFDSRGLVLTDEELTEIEESVESAWEYYSSYYEMNGIGKESFTKITELSYKSSALFESFYAENGTDAVPIDEVKEYYDENYVRTEYLAMSLNDSEGNPYDDETKAEIKELAEEYVERINKGEKLSEISQEYNEFITELEAELAEKAAAETEETTAETEQAEETSAETEEENISSEEVEVTEAEAENSEDVEEVTQETTEQAETEEEIPAETTIAEETETEETENAETVEETSSETDIAEETTAETDTTEEVETTTAETEEDFSNEQIIKKGSDDTSYTPSETVNKALFEQETLDEAFLIEDTDANTYYVAIKYDIKERKDLYEDESLIAILNEMMGDDYDEKLLEIVTLDTIVINDKAYNRYNPFDFEV